MKFLSGAQGMRLTLALISALSIAACSKNPTDLTASVAGGGAGGYATPGSQRDFTQNVGDRVFFDTDSTELSATAQATLDKQAQWLKQYPRYTFVVEGHADERGTREYNFALGARRADVTKNYLIARGISPSRMKTISFGKERPVATCDDISCWSQNRRAVTDLKGSGPAS
jgi:peptidoglycan-associated lipoprotein